MPEKLQNIITEFESIEQKMSDPSVFGDPIQMKVLGKKRAGMASLMQIAKKYLGKQKEITNLLEMEKDTDPEISKMAKMELESTEKEFKILEEEAKKALIPKNPNDEKDVIMEIRPAAGGEESSLFGYEYARAIFRYCENKKFTVELFSKSDSDSGGVKELIFAVRGDGAYSKLKYESGVHRVQRIPKTESQGRVHTSTITVVVMPEVEEIEFEIHPSDVRVDVFRSSGPGGQSVNTTDSAVRLTHIPTGVTVSCQDEKSQLKNKTKAFRILRARLHQAAEEKRMKEEGEKRLAQIGSGDRSEKIRTYNFPQDRVTDHRIHENFSNIPAIMDGDFDDIVHALTEAENLERLKGSGGK
ncbi:peptide chain release factor 1 [Candidatus Peregrinibacteria bacterium]|nr:peptide chain release factor 1 [Candidatus Peregrinibacteria bacterium]